MKLTSTYILGLISFLSLLFAWVWQTTEFQDDLTVVQLIESFGYPVESYEITTDDGYILTLHRIRSKLNNEAQNRTPVLLLHGTLNSAAEFVNLGPGKALSFLLVDFGYDVWLLNARGTTYSRKHQTLHPDQEDRHKYWNFSFHEIGVHDLPKTIDFILDKCDVPKLHIIGYSQGGSAVFALISEKPAYADKIRLMSGLAPAVYMGGPPSPLIKVLAAIRKFLEMLIWLFKVEELFANRGFVHVYLKNICHADSWFVDLCLFHFFSLNGDGHEQLDTRMLPQILHNLPAGVSSKQVLHLLQIVATGNFEKYNYGEDKNLRYYRNSTPPEYDLSKSTMPVALYYGPNDWTVPAKNMGKLAETLPNVIKVYEVPLEKFNHNDFLHAKDAPSLLYYSVIEEILKY